MSSDTPTAPPVSTLPPGKPGIPQGLYAMWRCVICIAHADGIIQPEERTYLEKIFANLDRVYGLTPTQKITLSSDLEVPQNLADLLTKVREPEYRSMLIYFGTLLANADGTVTEDEDKLLSMLHAQQMDSLDADQLREDIRLDIEKRKAELESETAALRADASGNSPILKALDKLLGKIGIDFLG